MSDYDDTNRGALFKNDKATDNQPGYTGTLNVEGKEYRIAGWVRQAKSSGRSYFSLSISEPQRQQSNPPEAHGAPTDGDFDDDIPF